MHTAFIIWIVLATGLVAAPLPVIARTPTASHLAAPDFSCNGDVHAQAIQLWEQEARSYFSKQINSNLNKNGDVYVLYYTQAELQSFVEMTRRCKDRQQIAELADTLNPVFASLRPLPNAPSTRGWVCTGGHTCTSANHQLGKEVQLCSAQFLGLIGAVATDIVETVPFGQQTATEKAFVVNAATAMATQVDNWLSPTYFKSVIARTQMTPADAKDGRSTYFFVDKDLWMMATLSDLAELHQAGIKPSDAGMQAFKSLQSKHNQIGDMFNLLLARITLIDAKNGTRAEIDRGYWRNYADSKYAIYSATTSPVLCQKNFLGLMQENTRIKSKASYLDSNLGWDLSHARRLVPAFNTFTRNRTKLATTFGYNNPLFDPIKLQRAFANQIVDKIWNRDRKYPLFSNFWDGSNGWYRAGYKSGIRGDCRPGQAPYSLAWSFPTGGYLQWGKFNNTIRTLALRLYQLFNSTDPTSRGFVSKYYRVLERPSGAYGKSFNGHDLWMLAFLSSLPNI
jgi:hypothetical protein